MDNATSYSPPESEAWVTARALGDRVIVQIGDEGVGLPAQRRAQLNDLLARPPAIDVATVRSMGLVVAGHLAARFGARVELRAGPRLGTIAEISLPAHVFRGGSAVESEMLSLPEGTPAIESGALPAGTPVNGGPGSRYQSASPGTGHQGNGRPPSWPPSSAPATARPATVPSPAAPSPAAPSEVVPAGVVPAGAGSPATGVPVAARTGRGQAQVPGTPIDIDQTTELPIFQQVNNWFHPDHPARTAAAADRHDLDARPPSDLLERLERIGQRRAERLGQPATGSGTPVGRQGGPVIPSQPGPQGQPDPARAQRATAVSGEQVGPAGQGRQPAGDGPGRATPVHPMDLPAEPELVPSSAGAAGWHTSSDDAWRAATALRSPQASSTTQAGLPQRVPQQHLVPPTPQTADQQHRADHRDPSLVAAALSAYARGVSGRQFTPATASSAPSTGSMS
jgi:hypothetical protein